jgi:hypothetical protein
MCQKSKKSCLEPETVEMPEFEEALPHRTQVIEDFQPQSLIVGGIPDIYAALTLSI